MYCNQVKNQASITDRLEKMLSVGWQAYNRCRKGSFRQGIKMNLKVLGSLGLMVLGGGAQAAARVDSNKMPAAG